MNIIKNTSIREKFHHGYPRDKNKVTALVIHGSGGWYGSTCDSWINYMHDPEGHGDQKRSPLQKEGILLYQYLVNRKGGICEIIDPENYVFAASIGRMERYCINVELINWGSANSGNYTEEQLQTVKNLFLFLKKDFQEISIITGHEGIYEHYTGQKLGKTCPGNFNFNELANLLENEGYPTFLRHNQFIEIKDK